jgi:protein TonB
MKRAWVLAALVALGCRRPDSVVPPRLVSPVPFQYPEALWDAGVEGRSVLRLWVDTAGRVDSVRLARSSGYPGFDSAALAAAWRLRFEPARRGARPLAVWVLLPVEFRLDTAGKR